jgi:hypothetical protein
MTRRTTARPEHGTGRRHLVLRDALGQVVA